MRLADILSIIVLVATIVVTSYLFFLIWRDKP